MRNIDDGGDETSSQTASDPKAFIATSLRQDYGPFMTSQKFTLRFFALPRGVFPESALRAFKKIAPRVRFLLVSAPG